MSDLEGNKANAVGFLVNNVELQPEGSAPLFDRINKSNESAIKIFKAMKEAQETYLSLEDKLKEIRGGNLAVVDIVADLLSEDQVEEYSVSFLKEKSEYIKSAQNEKDTPKPRPSMAGDTVNTSVAG